MYKAIEFIHITGSDDKTTSHQVKLACEESRLVFPANRLAVLSISAALEARAPGGAAERESWRRREWGGQVESGAAGGRKGAFNNQYRRAAGGQALRNILRWTKSDAKKAKCPPVGQVARLPPAVHAAATRHPLLPPRSRYTAGDERGRLLQPFNNLPFPRSEWIVQIADGRCGRDEDLPSLFISIANLHYYNNIICTVDIIAVNEFSGLFIIYLLDKKYNLVN